MPSRPRRSMQPAPKWGVWPADTSKLPDSRRNRVARAVYDLGDWIGEHNTTPFAEGVATYAGTALLAHVLLRQQAIIDKSPPIEIVIGGSQDELSASFHALAARLAQAAPPFAVAVGGAIVTRCMVPLVMGGAAWGARLLACSLIEVDKGPPISSSARKLLRVYGPLPPLRASVEGQVDHVEPLPAACAASRPSAGKKSRQRPARGKASHGPQPKRVNPPSRALRPSLPPSPASLRAVAPTPHADPTLPSAVPSAPCPAPVSTPLVSVAHEPLAPPDAMSDATPLALAPALMLDACAAVASPQGASLTTPRRDKAAKRADRPAKPRGPMITGLSCDNRVVIEQADALHWHPREDFSVQRLRSMRPAAHKTVTRAHRHTPSSALRQALGRVLCARQANGLRAQDIIDVLRRHGYRTFLVGGVVRDLLRDVGCPQRHPDVDLVTDAPASEVQRLVAMGLAHELPELTVTSSHLAYYQGVVSYQGIDVPSLRVRGMFEPKRLNHVDAVQVYPLSFGTHLPSDADNRDLTCNAVYYDPMHDLILDPTTSGIADAKAGVLRAPSSALAMLNKTWALRYLKFALRGFAPADAATTELMIANARKFFHAPRFGHTLARIHEGDFDTWCEGIADVLTQAGCEDLGAQVLQAAATAAR